jgi:hypothetical protein
MPTTLEEFDQQIRPHLHGIEAGAEMCRRHVDQLVYRPTFNTLAFDELQTLEKTLRAALDKVRSVQAAFLRLPQDE